VAPPKAKMGKVGHFTPLFILRKLKNITVRQNMSIDFKLKNTILL